MEAEILNYDKTDDLRDYLASISKQYWSVECLETFINILENDQADNLKDVIRVIASDSIIVDHCVSWVNP